MKKNNKKQGQKELIEKLEARKGEQRYWRFPTTSGKIEWGKVKMIDYVIHRQSNYPDKYFVLELIQPEWRKQKELRFGYYILGKKPKVFNRWVWGQSAPLVPLKDLVAIVRKIKQKGFIKK